MSSVTPSKMSWRRDASGARGLVLITPHSTSCDAPLPSERTTPYPVIAVPGSIPRTITGCGDEGSRLRHRGLIHVEVRVDLLHVVEFLERLDELEQRFGIGALDAHGTLWNPRELGRRRLQSDFRERLAHRVQI